MHKRADWIAQQPVHPHEQEQPDHVDEVPIPSRSLKADVLVGLELVFHGAEAADDEENRSHENVEAMEAGGEIERRGMPSVRLNAAWPYSKI